MPASSASSTALLHKEPMVTSAAGEVPDTNNVAVACMLEHKPISITLDGSGICGLAATLVLLIHFLESPYTEVLIVLTATTILIQNDYNNFIGLGPGGTPSTFQGYVRIAWLRLWALRDPLNPPELLPTSSSNAVRLPTQGILPASNFSSPTALPYRLGPRPTVAGIAPQRQLDQHGTLSHYLALRRTLESLAQTEPSRLGTARSCFERHGLALFARHPINPTCGGEIAHVHHSDHSLHMCLHPDDIREALEKGWGQRHPLARRRGGWFGSVGPMPVPEEFVMVYAPRDDHELQTVCRIIEAAIWYATAERQQIHVCHDT